MNTMSFQRKGCKEMEAFGIHYKNGKTTQPQSVTE